VPARTWKARAHTVIGIRGGNLGNTHTINMANAPTMEKEKRKRLAQRKHHEIKAHDSRLKTVCEFRSIKKIRVRYFHTWFSEFGRLRYAHAGARPGLLHTVCFQIRIPYMISHTAQFFICNGSLKRPMCTSRN
jgi:hypothetical protein